MSTRTIKVRDARGDLLDEKVDGTGTPNDPIVRQVTNAPDGLNTRTIKIRDAIGRIFNKKVEGLGTPADPFVEHVTGIEPGGDVAGPDSATLNNIAVFSNTDGKEIDDCDINVLDLMGHAHSGDEGDLGGNISHLDLGDIGEFTHDAIDDAIHNMDLVKRLGPMYQTGDLLIMPQVDETQVASAYLASSNTEDINNITDANPVTYWTADAGAYPWFILSIGPSLVVYKYRLLQGAPQSGQMARSYIIEKSLDKLSWISVYEVNLTALEDETIIFPEPFIANWVRFRANDDTLISGWRVFECELYSLDVIPTRLAYSSDGKILGAVDNLPAWIDPPISGVTGPESSSVDNFATFSSEDGQTIGDSGITKENFTTLQTDLADTTLSVNALEYKANLIPAKAANDIPYVNSIMAACQSSFTIPVVDSTSAGSAANLTDGNYETYWESNKKANSGDAWFYINLGQTMLFNAFRLTQIAGKIANYITIEGSNDLDEWTFLFDADLDETSPIIFFDDIQQYQYVKFTAGDGDNAKWRCSECEILSVTKTFDVIPYPTPEPDYLGSTDGIPTWKTGIPGGGMANPMTDEGDLIVGGTAGAPSVLTHGDEDEVLTTKSGILSWEALPVSGMANPMTDEGDLIVGGTAGAPDVLPVDDDGKVLTLVDGVPAWDTPVSLPLTQTGSMMYQPATEDPDKIIFLTSGENWTVPDDWNDAINKIECIGAGGNGGLGWFGGGGGGAYSSISNLSLTPGTLITIHVGDHAADHDTWFNGANLAGSSVGAKGGGNATQPASENGGAAASGVGTVKYSGGNGGAIVGEGGGGGGGGAAGPHGNGANGVSQGGGTGDAGFGGTANNPGTEYDANHGCGGGGNGGATNNGGSYGGGAGSGNWGNNGGTGAHGLIVITYTIVQEETLPVELLIGSEGQVLQSVGGIPAWTVQDGWIPSGQVWTYEAGDDPTYTFSEPIDATGKYSPGMRIKCTQGGSVKYGIITAVGAYSGGKTIITVYCGTDYDLGATITYPYYSTQKAPFGFPLDPAKWTISIVNNSLGTQLTPTTNTWYNIGSLSLSIPIGSWHVSYQVSCFSYDTVANNHPTRTTLSTANNSESDINWTCRFTGSSFAYLQGVCYRRKQLTLTTKTSYYLNATTAAEGLDALYFGNDNSPAIIMAECAYL